MAIRLPSQEYVIDSQKKGVFVKFRNLCHGVLGSLVAISVAASTSYAGVFPVVPVPEADPTMLLAIGVAAVGYLVGVSKYRSRK